MHDTSREVVRAARAVCRELQTGARSKRALRRLHREAPELARSLDALQSRVTTHLDTHLVAATGADGRQLRIG